METVEQQHTHAHSKSDSPEGIHLCYIYNKDEERASTMAKFVAEGLKAKNKVLCIVDTLNPHDISGELKKLGVDVGALSNDFAISDNDTSYCPEGAFEPDKLLAGIGVHPVMLIQGQIVKNPYFIAPDIFMNQYYARKD
ncbi:MAG: MEDS domain-containing protein [Candidatus Marinimicrobia bacterium]|nr:MEDS domain-containing protein [Candidatus Neomarinimicrobiota bacterium]